MTARTYVPMDVTRKVSVILGFALVASLPAEGHHSGAMFDHTVELTLTGVVTKFDYVNPHSWLYVDVRNEDGSMTAWGFELAAPPQLRRRGISPTYWRPGDRITVKTNPLKDGRPAGNLGGAVGADGKTFGDTEGLKPPVFKDNNG